MRVSSIKVQGLFGHPLHTVNLRQQEPTIVLAPNGAGKTHILKLTASLLSLEPDTLFNTPFTKITIELADGRSLVCNRTADESDEPRITLNVFHGERKLGEALSITLAEHSHAAEELPRHIRRVSADRWINERVGRTYTRAEMRKRFPNQVGLLAQKVEKHPSIEAFCKPPRPLFIDTWRLDDRVESYDLLGEWTPPRVAPTSGTSTRISKYVHKLRDEVVEARRASLRVTQSTDLSFARRALDAATLTVYEKDLHTRYDQTVGRYQELAQNGLAVGEAPIPFPEKTTPTVRRILSVFLDDWDRRLEPLLPINKKLQTLRDILNAKLLPSGKSTAMSQQGGLEFHTLNGSRLPVSKLSSGEQHLVALFTLLLFATKPGSLVLIDEPEISLHAAWKHDFLPDITRVAEVNDLQIVLATHSAGIVNGRWDLAEELELHQISPKINTVENDILFEDDEFDE